MFMLSGSFPPLMKLPIKTSLGCEKGAGQSVGWGVEGGGYEDKTAGLNEHRYLYFIVRQLYQDAR